MQRLMIACPMIQKPLPTGITIDEATFKDPTRRMGHHATSCPHCHGVHRWSKDNAVLEPEPPMR